MWIRAQVKKDLRKRKLKSAWDQKLGKAQLLEEAKTQWKGQVSFEPYQSKGRKAYVEDKATVETRQYQKIMKKFKERIFTLISKSADIIKRKNTSFYSIFKVCLCLSSPGSLLSAAAVVI